MEPAITGEIANLTPEIRKAGSSELELAYAIVSEYYEAVHVVARETRERFLQDYFAPSAGVWLAHANREIVGCIALRSLQDNDSAEIKRMYVRPAWRGHGLAQRLLEAAESFAAHAGYRSIYLDTTDQMQAAAKLYERNGYRRCDRYNENPQATIFMKKVLRLQASASNGVAENSA